MLEKRTDGAENFVYNILGPTLYFYMRQKAPA